MVVGRDRAGGERLGDPEDHGHGCAQLVRQARHEIVTTGRALHERLLRGLELGRPPPFALERVGELVDHAGRDVRREHRAAARGAQDRGQDLVAVGILQHVARGAGDQHLADDVLVLVPRQGDHAGRGEPFLEHPCRLDAVHLRHVDVHQDHVGPEVGDEIERLEPGLRLADHEQVGGVEQGKERLSEAGVVIDDEDPHTAGAVGRPGGKDRGCHLGA